MYSGSGLVTKSCPTLVTLWTVVCQAPLSTGFPRQEYWGGCNSLFRGSSWPRDGTIVSCISCIGRRNLFHWVIWEALHSPGFRFKWYKVRPEDKEGLKPTQGYCSMLPGWQTIEYNFYYQTKVLIVIYQERVSWGIYCKICMMKNVFIF